MSLKQQQQQGLFGLVVLCVCLLMSSHIQVSAWSTGSQKPFVRAGSMTSHRKQQPVTSMLYAPPSSPSSTSPAAVGKPKPSITAQKMLKDTTAFSSGSSSAKKKKKNSPFKLSHSVLASCDTLPSCPTAHGILSPETVMRMDQVTKSSPYPRSDALINFLETYRRDGPMSCLPMLSDPQVLPHLTNAMRDIVA